MSGTAVNVKALLAVREVSSRQTLRGRKSGRDDRETCRGNGTGVNEGGDR